MHRIIFKHVRRKTRWLLVILLLGLVAIGAAFYTVYFVSTDTAVRHAEAFRFRRMTVTQLAEQGVYRFFYATNRQQNTAPENTAEQFGAEHDTSLQLGFFDAAIEPSLGLGMLINPTHWLQNEEIQLRNRHSLQPPEFAQQLSAKVVSSPHDGLLIAVHGFRESHQSALRKTAFLGHVLDINAPVLVFDWPGNQGSSLRGYRRAHQIASQSGAELAELIKLVVSDVKPQRLWIVANSMGAQVVVKALDQLHSSGGFGREARKIEHVILTAPDVSRDALDNQFRDSILGLSEHLTVYVSSNDRALLVSRLVNRDARGGESTLSPEQLDEADRIFELIRPGDRVIDLVDVTPVNRTRNFHNFSLETPEFFDDLYLRISNESLPRNRLLYRVETADGRVYSVLTQGR